MYQKNKVSKRKVFISIMSVLLVAIVLFGAGAWYVNDYYRADTEAIELFAAERSVSREILDDNTIIFAPEDATTGFIFYPGGKVEYSAYMPLLQECAEQGIMCALIEMPFNLAVLDVNAADGIQEKYPQISDWYIGGHSLGGSMAASYLEKNLNDYEGLVLLGSYSTADLSDSDIKVLSVYGSEDKILNLEKYNKYKANLPEGFEELVIEGACHAYFGMYGEQEGDGIPAISCEEQVCLASEEIISWMEE